MVQRPNFYVTVGGSTCDVNYVIADDFGGFNGNPAQNVPPSGSEEDDMAVIFKQAGTQGPWYELLEGPRKHALTVGELAALHDAGAKMEPNWSKADLDAIPTA
jgi:hypothetical protein